MNCIFHLVNDLEYFFLQKRVTFVTIGCVRYVIQVGACFLAKILRDAKDDTFFMVSARNM